jgi:PAS domain S-box-containing protein
MRPEDLGIGKLFERVRDAVIVADAETQRVVLWNPAATNIFGYTLSEALELRVEALVPEHLKALHRAGMIHYWETGHGYYIDSQWLLDLPALKKGGEEIRIELSLNPIVLADPLTAREAEILGLLAQGRTNPQIARELVVSPGTVKNHVRHIIAKLGVSDRTQAAVRAVELGLLTQS